MPKRRLTNLHLVLVAGTFWLIGGPWLFLWNIRAINQGLGFPVFLVGLPWFGYFAASLFIKLIALKRQGKEWVDINVQLLFLFIAVQILTALLFTPMFSPSFIHEHYSPAAGDIIALLAGLLQIGDIFLYFLLPKGIVDDVVRHAV